MFLFFFFNDTATTEIYTLSLHDALPICVARGAEPGGAVVRVPVRGPDVRRDRALRHRAGRSGQRPAVGRRGADHRRPDRKSTRLNSSHLGISYAVFCLKKKKIFELLTEC